MAAPRSKPEHLTAPLRNRARLLWSVPAAMRAVRATIVIPGLFAITSKVIGDPQMALYATFGGFATLVVTSFGGSRRDKITAHLGFAITGSVALVIGTLVSGIPWLAAVVTVPVAFMIFFAGVLGPVPAVGCTGLLFAYVLPVASVGGASTLGSRLEGWWLVSAASVLAILLLSPSSPGDRIRAAAADLAAEIASRLRKGANGEASDPAAMTAARKRLRAAFTSAPYRPTGLATADQALTSVIQLLDWAAAQVTNAFDQYVDMTQAAPAERDLLRITARLFEGMAALLAGSVSGKDAFIGPVFEELERSRAAATQHLRDLSAGNWPTARAGATHAVHAQAIAVAARSAAADTLIAARRADPATIAAARRQWYGVADPASQPSGVAGVTGVVLRHASVRSVWFANSLRGAAALAVAVAVADLSNVQHGFWIVLGTLSVLRSNATGTGSTALRALGGTAIGFVVGAALLAAIGTGETAMWVAFPLSVLIAAYAPGTLPFAIGQAAFTILIVLLFNLLSPVGWRVGLLRVEDIAIGCVVSVVVGLVFWPRGASALVGQDLADAFRSGARYLTQAVDWALSERGLPPEAAVAAVTASLRLDDALRGFLAEQGAKRVSKEDLWSLVTATQQLRLTAHTLAGLRDAPDADSVTGPVACLPLEGSESYTGTPACVSLQMAAAGLADFYGRIADEVAYHGRDAPTPVPAPVITGPAMPPRTATMPGETEPDAPAPSASPRPHPHLLWVQDHLHHLSLSAQAITGPALHVAESRRHPWWR